MASKHKKRARRSIELPRLSPQQRWVHGMAWALCAVTFPLVWLGGLVTTTKSGMAVPDWPNTYGYNLFLYPVSSWLFGPWDLFVEHGHRLLASLAGVLTIVLLILLWRHDGRPWMKAVGILALVGVVSQGVLGGLRVVLDDRLFALLHGCTGPLFFALTVAIVVWTSPRWLLADLNESFGGLQRLVPLALTTSLLVFVQIVLGAMLRHMPATASPQSFEHIVKSHLFMAVVVATMMLAVAWRGIRVTTPRVFRRWGLLLLLLIATQLGLGVSTWLAKYGTPIWTRSFLPTSATPILSDGWWQSHVVTAHQATGSLLLVLPLAMALIAWRLAPPMATDASSTEPSLPKGAATS